MFNPPHNQSLVHYLKHNTLGVKKQVDGTLFPINWPPGNIRPKYWGFEIIDFERSTKNYLIKYLVFLCPDAFSSIHAHKEKTELFYITPCGIGKAALHIYSPSLSRFTNTISLPEFEPFLIPPNTFHLWHSSDYSDDECHTGLVDTEEILWLNAKFIVTEFSFFPKSFKNLDEIIAADATDNIKLSSAGVADWDRIESELETSSLLIDLSQPSSKTSKEPPKEIEDKDDILF